MSFTLRNILKSSTLFSCLLFCTALIAVQTPISNNESEKAQLLTVEIETTQGPITLQLFPHVAPKACENFIGHVESGYYNNVLFHRIIPGFMVQGGDPAGSGVNGKSIWGKPFEDEFAEGVAFDKPGILAMANSGPNTNGSQFFITVAKTPWLNKKHTIFGQVIKGYENVERLSVQGSSTGSPKSPQKIISAKVLNKPSKPTEKVPQKATNK